MNTAPIRIWLQRDDDDSRHPCETEGVTWCEDKINDYDTEYVRADLLATALDAAIAKAKREENEACAKVLDEMAEQAERDIEPSAVVDYYHERAAYIRSRMADELKVGEQ